MIQADKPNMIKPNNSFTATRYFPDVGSHLDAVRPITISGIPKPMLKAVSATIPRKISPL